MVRLLAFFASIVILSTGAVFAQEIDGTVTLYADPWGTDCHIVAPPSGVTNVYVFFVKSSRSATAIEFSAPAPACLQAIYAGEVSPFPLVIGDSQTGVAISFGGCTPTPIHLLTIVYVATGATAACCRYPVLPYPGRNHPRFAGCDDVAYNTGGDEAFINQDASCPCTFPVPVEATTWGAIKAQYN